MSFDVAGRVCSCGSETCRGCEGGGVVCDKPVSGEGFGDLLLKLASRSGGGSNSGCGFVGDGCVCPGGKELDGSGRGGVVCDEPGSGERFEYGGIYSRGLGSCGLCGCGFVGDGSVCPGGSETGWGECVGNFSGETRCL